MASWKSHRSVACVALFSLAPLWPAPAWSDPSLAWQATAKLVPNSTYQLGEPVSFDFAASDFSGDPPSLELKVVDADDRTVAQTSIAMSASGSGWQAHFAAPSGKLGLFRVYAAAHSGGQSATLPALGTMPAGAVTYAVVPAIASRPALSEDAAFFGVQGGFSGASYPLVPALGIRWLGTNLEWSRLESERPHQLHEALEKKTADTTALTPTIAVPGGGQWITYPFASLHARLPAWAKGMKQDELDPAWSEYCASAAKLFRSLGSAFPRHVYQITWEPDVDAAFKGDTAAAVLNIYQLAYPAIHVQDPSAVVIGPTFSNIDPGMQSFNRQLMQHGMLRYVDGWSVHPYSRAPHIEVLQTQLRQLKADMQALSGKQVPVYATEHGYMAKAEPADERNEARYDVESNVVLYGEGSPLAVTFYIHDYIEHPGFGLYYNLDAKVPYGTDWVAPKPAAAAYAAMTWMLEGTRGAGVIQPGNGLMGYAFTGKKGQVFVVWSVDDGVHQGQVDCRQGASLKTYDWMGNVEGTAACRVARSFGPNPTYLQTGR